MNKISVIIPIYNSEEYLRKCLNSVINSTYKALEIICVNDGSTDSSLEICDEFKEKDNRIMVINQKNGGTSKAVNTGLDNATGDYIYYMDSDDFIDKIMFEKLIEVLLGNNCDIVISGYKTFPQIKQIIPNYKLNKPMNPIELIKSNSVIHTHNDLCFSWRFMFKQSVLKNIRFKEELLVGEDFIFNLEALSNSKKVIAIDKCFYNYRINNPNSIMTQKYKPYLEKNLLDQYKYKKSLSKEFGIYKDNYKYDMALYYINGFIPMLMRNIYNSNKEVTIKDIRRILDYDMFRDSFKIIGRKYKSTNYKEYIAFLLMKYRFYNRILEIENKMYKR